MIRIALALLILATPALSAAQSEERVIRPEIRLGDRWTYRSKNMLSNGTDTYDLRVANSDDTTIQVVATRRSDAREFDATFTSEWNAVVGVSGLIFTPSATNFFLPAARRRCPDGVVYRVKTEDECAPGTDRRKDTGRRLGAGDGTGRHVSRD